MKIFTFHLLNDYSGSPKVLMQLIKGWTDHDIDVTVVTCSGREGFLSNLSVHYIEYWYRWAANPFVRLFNLVLSQIILFTTLLRLVKKNDIIYINTVLPFGAAFLGRVKGCRIIYHIHETSIKPVLLKHLLFGIMRWAATDVIYVSNYLATQERVANKRIHILPNAIENDFLKEARAFVRPERVPQNILMVCSLKFYKGVNEFITLAQLHQALHFRLVVNATQQELDKYVKNLTLPLNLALYPVQTYLHPFYHWADVIVNLSRPDIWIETFGLTIIEGMAHGLPAIVPPVGGIVEVVDDGMTGYCVDSRQIDQVSEKLNYLCDPVRYKTMKQNALVKINSFNETAFIDKSLQIISGTRDGIHFQ